MFAAIAPTYDRLNRIISFRFDQLWRREAVARINWERRPGGRYLDLCAGTLDFAAILARQPGFRGQVIGADFVPAMLRLGLSKAKGMAPVAADALELPFADVSFDGVMVGWGLRNLVDLDGGLREVARVLKPGSHFTVIETGTPTRQPWRGLFLWYFGRVLPWIGRIISHHATAYQWLPDSTRALSSPEELAERIRGAGFREVTIRRLMFGATTLLVGVRQ
jgi:demethylmenaquinone methyltransferase/2-methoxy-6-polyprenyl-1,4-benzoquinol methylase